MFRMQYGIVQKFDEENFDKLIGSFTLSLFDGFENFSLGNVSLVLCLGCNVMEV